MISQSEISQKAKEFEINTSDLQRDYVFGWMIHGMFTQSSIKDSIFLKGGNALRKGYFENTRYSNDLDFGIPDDIDPEMLLADINKVCEYISTKAEIQFLPDDNKVEEKFTAEEAPLPDLKVYEAKVYFKDFNGGSAHIRLKITMDITRFDKVILPLQEVELIHPYSDAAEASCKIRCMKLEEIIATKLKCLLQRQHAPDLFDYAYSIKLLGGKLNKDEVVTALIQKTIFDRNPHMLKSILLETPTEFFKEFWKKTVICAKAALFTVEDAFEVLKTDLEELFRPYPDNGFRDFAYFGPQLRHPIMRAGRDQTVLKIKYKGADRIVEPYSLKYRQKKGGEPREYFYAYNVSGGNNLPGIRSFIAQNMESIENTNEKFQPRDGSIIELSKAGEMPENYYMFDPNRPERVPRQRSGFSSIYRSRSSRGYNGPKYTYQCITCGKQVTKRNQDSSIGPHKAKGRSYPCGGRYGSYRGMHY